MSVALHLTESALPAITAESLGGEPFKSAYGIRYAYVTGAMYKGVASAELVAAMGKAGMLGYLGTGGMSFDDIETSIRFIQAELGRGQSFGVNMLCDLSRPDYETRLIDLYLRLGIRFVEAAAYMQVTPGLVRFLFNGLRYGADGQVESRHRIMAKVSRPEVAEAFMRPAPEYLVRELLDAGLITREQAELGRHLPLAEDICVEADSGGHTDKGVSFALIPSIRELRERLMAEYRYHRPINIGAATVEAGTSAEVKEMLQSIDVQDTAYAPAGDMFELGAQVQVLQKGVFFPARANKLYSLYRQYDSLEALDSKTRSLLQEKYFKRSFDSIWEETLAYYGKIRPGEIEKARHNPKHKMALIFKWYFVHSSRLALGGSETQKVDYQVHCGPAMGAFNQWTKGGSLESWRNRYVADIGQRLMHGAADVLNRRLNDWLFAGAGQRRFLSPLGQSHANANIGLVG
ncbi:MAG: 2-nitropropane dioxygenase [Exilibacterium sp.]